MATEVHDYGNGTCALARCGRTIPVGFLMCQPHWQQVPQVLRNAVWSALRGWMAGTVPLGQLRQAQEAAIAALAL